MQRREAFQLRVLDDLEGLARSVLDPDWEQPEPDDGLFSGFYMPYADAWELWRQWEAHGFMPDPGGYWDQHPHWRHMIHMFRRAYAYKVWLVRQEVKARRENKTQ